MSQIASFIFLKASDVPHLGFWSKPKPRLFRKPESKFDELLRPHVLRQQVFKNADGVYVALAFAWIESLDKKFSRDADPVIGSVRKNLGGSHWLMKSTDQRLGDMLDKPLDEREWLLFLTKVAPGDKADFTLSSFDDARLFVRDRLSEIAPTEALFVTVG